MTIIITTLFRTLAFLTIALAAFQQNDCSGGKTGTAKNADPKVNATPASSNTIKPTGIKLFVPSYFNDDDYSADGKGEWNKLIKYLEAGDVLILNPHDGPDTVPKEGFTTVVKDARAKGIVVLGYVYTLDKEKKPQHVLRDPTKIKADIVTFEQFYSIKDIFFDELDPESAPKQKIFDFYSDICKFVHDRGGKTTLNPGKVPDVDERLAKITDTIIAFEADYALYRDRPNTYWGWSSKPEYQQKIVHLVHTTGEGEWKDAVSRAMILKVSFLFVTDKRGDKVWDSLPDYWEKEVNEIRK